MALTKWMSLLSRIVSLSRQPYQAFKRQSRALAQVANSPTTTRNQTPKPFSSIPGPRSWPLIGSTLDLLSSSIKEPHTLHKYANRQFEKYGPVFRMQLGKFTLIMLHDPDDIQTIWKHEGKYPKRIDFEPWKMYREDHGHNMGVLCSDGEEWQRNRSAMNHHMMRPQNVAMHTDDFTEVARDFMECLADELKISGNGKVRDLRQLLFLWSFESGCTMICEERLGCLSKNQPEDAQKFKDAVQGVLRTTENLMAFPPTIAKALGLSIWKVHSGYWDEVFRCGKKLMVNKLNRVKSDLESGKDVSGLVASMLQSGSIGEDEITASIVDLMLGSVETTSLTVLYTAYLLSKNPEKQQKLHEEILKVRGPGGAVGQKEIRNMSYMKAVIKETLRILPVAPFTSRNLAEDAVIGGYFMPKNTSVFLPLWAMGRDPDIYSDPEAFRPERWLRENAEAEAIHPFANLHFGYGHRSCIGRRVAELKMYIILAQLLQKYEVLDGTPGQQLETENRVVLMPKEAIDVIFKERNT